MMGPRKVSAREEADRLQIPWIGRIQNRDAVAEHVSDIKMTAIEHDLNAIRPSSDIAVGEMTEALADSLWRNGALLRARFLGQRRQHR